MKVPLAKPHLPDEDLHAVTSTLQSMRWVLGPKNLEFEKQLALASGRRHAICVSSGTSALELGLWSLDIGRNDEVIVPAAGFPAAANAVLRLGGTPVPVDVNENTWCATAKTISHRWTNKTKAVVTIDQFGLLVSPKEIENLCRQENTHLIDDAACALGATLERYQGGNYGVFGTFSFHPRKVISTGEGGALVVDDDNLADRIRQLRNHGQYGRGQFARPGTNVRLPEVAAAMGIGQVRRLQTYITKRQAVAATYHSDLKDLEQDGKIAWQKPSSSHAYQTFGLVLDKKFCRDKVIQSLAENGIEAGIATYSLGRLPNILPPAPYPIADSLHDHGIALPMYFEITQKQVEYVCFQLRKVLA